MNLPKPEIVTCVGLTKSVHAYIMKPRNIIEFQDASGKKKTLIIDYK